MAIWYTKLAGYFLVWWSLVSMACSVGFLTQGCQLNWVYAEGEARAYCLDHVCNINAYTAIPLDWCIANIDGVLTAQGLGHFRERCFNCKIASDHYHLKCDCIKVDGTIVHSEINMNDVLYNWWGWLSCFGYYEKVYKRDYPCKGEGWMPDPRTPDNTCGKGCNEVVPPEWASIQVPAMVNTSISTLDPIADFEKLAGQAGPRPSS